MNGPVRMYKMRQVVRHDLKVPLPDCMYRLKNLHAANDEAGPLGDHVSRAQQSVDISDQVKQFLKNFQHSPELAALMERQRRILQQLAELRQQMVSLKSVLSANNGPNMVKVLERSFVCPVEIRKLPNIIINVSPDHPPYSLLLIQKLCKDCFHVRVKVHLHSSISWLLDSATALSKTLESHEVPMNHPVLNLRLIWKDVGPNAELIVSQTRIVGEANMLRYLARIVPDLLPYEDLENVTEIDSILDTCYSIVQSTTKSARISSIQLLSKKLGKFEWLCGHKRPTIADIAASSAIKQVAASEVNQGMAKWLQRCEALVT